MAVKVILYAVGAVAISVAGIFVLTSTGASIAAFSQQGNPATILGAGTSVIAGLAIVALAVHVVKFRRLQAGLAIFGCLLVASGLFAYL